MRIVAVSYFNTLPFIYGLRNSGLLENTQLRLEVPSKCSELLENGEADIALVPVVTANANPQFKIVTNYCIGAVGKVDSVLLLSHKPLSEITHIHLDFDSRTSVTLVKVLAKYFWNISPIWLPHQPNANAESVVLIGDKTFAEKEKYPYCYDLSEEWFKYTQLPFVFACWVSANNTIQNDYYIQLNNALEYGINHITEVVNEAKETILTKEQMLYYYQHSISYNFDEKKQEGMQLFLEKVSAI